MVLIINNLKNFNQILFILQVLTKCICIYRQRVIIKVCVKYLMRRNLNEGKLRYDDAIKVFLGILQQILIFDRVFFFHKLEQLPPLPTLRNKLI